MSTKKFERSIVKSFQFAGLTLRPDALTLIRDALSEEFEPQQKLNSLISAIDRNELSSSVVDAEAVKQLFTASIEQVINGTTPGVGMDVDVEEVDLSSIKVDDPLRVVSAFDVPAFQYNSVKKVFERDDRHRVLFPNDAKGKSDIFRERYKILHQRILRHPAFSPPVLSSLSRGKGATFPLTQIDAIPGTTGTLFVFGMVTQTPDGSFALEDMSGRIPISFDKLTKRAPGFFTETAFCILEGQLSEDGDCFVATKIAQPVPETREASLVATNELDLFGAGFKPKELPGLRQQELELSFLSLVVLVDVYLDNDAVLTKLEESFAAWDKDPPAMIILCGTFSERTVEQDASGYEKIFNHLASMLKPHSHLRNITHFVFVPGPNDPSVASVLPQKPLPSFCQEKINSCLKRVTFTTNPCRIRFFTREIVVFRHELMNRIRRNNVLPMGEVGISEDHLTRTLIEQAHLIPLPLRSQPIYWMFDHSLRLYPHPHFLILADRYPRFKCSFHETTVVNPGSFGRDPSDKANGAIIRPLANDDGSGASAPTVEFGALKES